MESIKNKALKKIVQENKEIYNNLFFKLVKKEDFPQILMFLNDWYLSESKDPNNVNFYTRLNMVKKCMEHLYELDIFGIIMQNEEKIYGLALGSIFKNTAYLHMVINYDNVDGLNEILTSTFAQAVSGKARYVNIEENINRKETGKSTVKPIKIEGFYSTFQL